MDLFRGLNNEQRKAVEAGEGPVMIVAGPGTGKTKTLTARIAYLLTNGRARSDQILALAFTKKAAEEMRTRLQTMLPKQKLPRIATFHALCHELLGGEFTFASDTERLHIIKQLSKPASLKHIATRELALLISRAKNKADDNADVARLVVAYNDALHKENLADFDDLLVRAHEHLQHNEEARGELQNRFAYILVDEFQDTNRLQYELLHLLCSHDNMFVIGDPNQSIYGFRGASGGIFDQFAADFPKHAKVTLSTNYRSAPPVVHLANAIFGNYLQPATHTPGEVRAVQVLNEYGEANWVLSEIQAAIGGSDFLKAVSDDRRQEHRRLSDFAVLYRNRSAAMALRRVLDDSGLPYQVVGDGSPYDQAAIQAIIAKLREQAPGADPSVSAPEIMKELGIEPTRDIHQFLSSLVRCATVREALEYIDQLAEQNFYDPRADAISLLTIHAAKGLEFPHVFLIGAEEGLLPHDRADKDEEKRLFYVAVTRAKERLDVLYTTWRGGKEAHCTSFADLAENILPKIIDPNLNQQRKQHEKRRQKRRQVTLFDV